MAVVTFISYLLQPSQTTIFRDPQAH